MAKVVLVDSLHRPEVKDKLWRSELSRPTAKRAAEQYNKNKPYDSEYTAIYVEDAYQLH